MSDIIPQITPDKITRALQRCALAVESTAKHKCPVRTGHLRNSITSEVDGDVAIVGTNVEYAPYVEYGTINMDAQPYLVPALNENEAYIKAILLEALK